MQQVRWISRGLVGIGLILPFFSGALATEPPPIEPPEAVPKLLAQLKESDPDLRQEAVVRLANVYPRSDETFRTIRLALVQALKDGNKMVRYKAAVSLSTVDPSSEEAVSVLLQVLEDKDEALRARPKYRDVSFRDSVIWHLGDLPLFSERTVPVLIQIVREGTPRSFALHPLAKLGRPAVPALVELLKDNDPTLRMDAAETLGEMGLVAEEAAPALVQCLKDKDEQVESVALFALVDMGEAAVPALTEALQETEALEEEDEDFRFPHSTSKCNTYGFEGFRWCFKSEAFPRPVIEPALNR